MCMGSVECEGRKETTRCVLKIQKEKSRIREGRGDWLVKGVPNLGGQEASGNF